MSIAYETILLPSVIADSVCGEAAYFLKSDIPLGYSNRLAERADAVYEANKRFRRMLNGKGDRPRDMLYGFMRHWLAGFIRKDHPALFRRLPAGFANGGRS